MKVPYTCPLIDEIIDNIKDSDLNGVPEKLEQLRDMNKVLRYEASYWKKLYKYATYGEQEFNPEVLPKS